jgi:hypothetical protein
MKSVWIWKTKPIPLSVFKNNYSNYSKYYHYPFFATRRSPGWSDAPGLKGGWWAYLEEGLIWGGGRSEAGKSAFDPNNGKSAFDPNSGKTSLMIYNRPNKCWGYCKSSETLAAAWIRPRGGFTFRLRYRNSCISEILLSATRVLPMMDVKCTRLSKWLPPVSQSGISTRIVCFLRELGSRWIKWTTPSG